MTLEYRIQATAPAINETAFPSVQTQLVGEYFLGALTKS